MIENDLGLHVTQERIVHFQRLLANIRKSANPKEFPAVSSGYRLEIERMQADVLDYLTRPVTHTNEPVEVVV